jgi:putative membrane protein
MMGFGFIFMIIFWIGLMLLAIWLVGLLFPSAKTPESKRSEPSPSAPEILRERYAKGEISTKQYQEMIKTIEQ